MTVYHDRCDVCDEPMGIGHVCATPDALRAALERGYQPNNSPQWRSGYLYAESIALAATASAVPAPMPGRSCRHGIMPDECEFCDGPGADKEEATRQAIRAATPPSELPDQVPGANQDAGGIPIYPEVKHAAWCWLPLDHKGMCDGDQ